MKISSKLLPALVPTVIGIMVLYAVRAVRQCEGLLLARTEADARVVSSAVSIAPAHALRDLEYQDPRENLAQIDDEPSIYGVDFYDPGENATIRSDTIQPGDVASRQMVRWSLDRIPVFSSGVSTRINVLGALLVEIYYAYPWQRPDKGGHFGFELAPGW